MIEFGRLGILIVDNLICRTASPKFTVDPCLDVKFHAPKVATLSFDYPQLKFQFVSFCRSAVDDESAVEDESERNDVNDVNLVNSNDVVVYRKDKIVDRHSTDNGLYPSESHLISLQNTSYCLSDKYR